MDAIALIVVFQSVNGVMTEGVARAVGYSFSDGGRCSVPLDCIRSSRSTCRTVLASGCFLDLCIFEAGSGDKSGLVRISFKEPKVDQDAFDAVIFETVPDSLATSFDIKNELHRSGQMRT